METLAEVMACSPLVMAQGSIVRQTKRAPLKCPQWHNQQPGSSRTAVLWHSRKALGRCMSKCLR